MTKKDAVAKALLLCAQGDVDFIMEFEDAPEQVKDHLKMNYMNIITASKSIKEIVDAVAEGLNK
jgi:hypothetical protein